jgi:hypothetical protein
MYSLEQIKQNQIDKWRKKCQGGKTERAAAVQIQDTLQTNKHISDKKILWRLRSGQCEI